MNLIIITILLGISIFSLYIENHKKIKDLENKIKHIEENLKNSKPPSA